MATDNKPPCEREIDELLQFLMPKPKPPNDERRFRFAVGMMLLSLTPFCFAILLFPSPAPDLVSKVMWIGSAMNLVVFGAWLINNSIKDGAKLAADQTGSSPPGKPLKQKPNLRIVK